MVIVLGAIYQNGNLKNTQSLRVVGLGRTKYVFRKITEACVKDKILKIP